MLGWAACISVLHVPMDRRPDTCGGVGELECSLGSPPAHHLCSCVKGLCSFHPRFRAQLGTLSVNSCPVLYAQCPAKGPCSCDRPRAAETVACCPSAPAQKGKLSPGPRAGPEAGPGGAQNLAHPGGSGAEGRLGFCSANPRTAALPLPERALDEAENP